MFKFIKKQRSFLNTKNCVVKEGDSYKVINPLEANIIFSKNHMANIRAFKKERDAKEVLVNPDLFRNGKKRMYEAIDKNERVFYYTGLKATEIFPTDNYKLNQLEIDTEGDITKKQVHGMKIVELFDREKRLTLVCTKEKMEMMTMDEFVDFCSNNEQPFKVEQFTNDKAIEAKYKYLQKFSSGKKRMSKLTNRTLITYKDLESGELFITYYTPELVNLYTSKQLVPLHELEKRKLYQENDKRKNVLIVKQDFIELKTLNESTVELLENPEEEIAIRYFETEEEAKKAKQSLLKTYVTIDRVMHSLTVLKEHNEIILVKNRETGLIFATNWTLEDIKSTVDEGYDYVLVIEEEDKIRIKEKLKSLSEKIRNEDELIGYEDDEKKIFLYLKDDTLLIKSKEFFRRYALKKDDEFNHILKTVSFLKNKEKFVEGKEIVTNIQVICDIYNNTKAKESLFEKINESITQQNAFSRFELILGVEETIYKNFKVTFLK